ncbi:MAG: FkbM family methyltransferase [Polaribacter sp.]|nr:FkbM family methyltransferase [Polaribacter sp.]
MIQFNLFSKKNNQQRKERKIQKRRCKPWFKINGDKTLRLNYDLSQSSIVFDVGGYKGNFAQEIYKRYFYEIFIFEPVKSFYKIIDNKFKNIPKVTAYPFGLANNDKELFISNSEDASSVFIDSDGSEKIKLKSILTFINDNKITHVDLIKINIEGGEYEVLESLLSSGMIPIFKNLQIQFHDFIIDNANERMENIQAQLAKTHKITYQYKFVWENWEIK